MYLEDKFPLLLSNDISSLQQIDPSSIFGILQVGIMKKSCRCQRDQAILKESDGNKSRRMIQFFTLSFSCTFKGNSIYLFGPQLILCLLETLSKLGKIRCLGQIYLGRRCLDVLLENVTIIRKILFLVLFRCRDLVGFFFDIGCQSWLLIACAEFVRESRIP